MREVLTLPADRKVLRQVAHLIDRCGGFARLNEVETHDVQVAVAEVCTNAIIHGLEDDHERSFTIEADVEGNTLIITLKEDGKPFDFEAIQAADLNSSLKERRIGGLGIHLIFNLMDNVEYSLESNGLKIVKMTKTASVTD